MGSESKRGNWSEEETLVLFNAFFSENVKEFSNLNSKITLKYSSILGRSVGAVKAKMENIRTANPAYKLKKTNSARFVYDVWSQLERDYRGMLAMIGNAASAYLENHDLVSNEVAIGKIDFNPGANDIRECRVRKGQAVFRFNVANNFERRCCITGIEEGSLLVASHIKPWSESTPEEMTDPGNGLFLNRLHDGLFDKHLMTIDQDMRILYSDGLENSMPEDVFDSFFKRYEGRKIAKPVNFEINFDYLAHHNREFNGVKD